MSVGYDGATLAVIIACGPTAALDCEEPVEATPIADTDEDSDDEAPAVLAATGLDTLLQAGAGVGAILLGAALVVLGRSRYRGAHVGG